MTNPNDTYTSPLASRNASEEMLRIWSPRHKFQTWRRIWLAVAEAQHEVTKDWDTPLVSAEQVGELKAVVDRGITDEELARASEIERELRHDVMAHVHCLGERCPKAKPIIHLGCTSQDVVCNADLLILREAIALVDRKLDAAIIALADQAEEWRSLPVLGFTHYQAAQPTTVGRRLAGYSFDLHLSSHHLMTMEANVGGDVRGFRGATGTQASFLSLFGDAETVDKFEAAAVSALLSGRAHTLDEWVDTSGEAAIRTVTRRHLLAPMRGDELDPAKLEAEIESIKRRDPASLRSEGRADYLRWHTFSLTGQTYPRVFDSFVLAALASTASVLHKIATDIRLLVNRKELDEPFGSKQIGSSAMPYKRNPMRCERICGLTRFVMNLVGNAYDTAATQWLERTLDDSSNRRLSLPEAFLALDGALDLMHNVASGLVVHEAMVRRNLMDELPFLATENILMEAVKAGGDRQDLHEKIRVHAQAAGSRVKDEGLDNDLLERLQNDPAFHPPALTRELDWEGLMDPMKYVGRSVEQTERFITEVVEPLREQYADQLDQLGTSEPKV